LSIQPLPQFEADLAAYLKEQEDREAYERLNAPSTIVVRFGYMRMVGEFPYSGSAKPGCGSKLVVKTHRGTELGEMLTSTCKNAGCAKSVTRKEMLEYIENSGGRQYPFYDRGRVLRIATVDDLNTQSRIVQRKNELRMLARRMVEEAQLAMTIIEAEPILGNERVVIYFGAEDRVDFRDLVSDLQREVGTKVELRQIGARDEARITADYERCGQYCCCKGFLKVLKPVSMKSAKVQKATLDPLKISGRCGRLMCCLRYEDETYEALRKNLPNRKSRVGTPEGDGIVISTQILTQLALVRLDNNTDVAIPIEDLCEPDAKVAPERPARSVRTRRGDTGSGGSSGSSSSGRGERKEDRDGDGKSGRKRGRSRTRSGSAETAQQSPETGTKGTGDTGEGGVSGGGGTDRPKKKRRRRRRRSSTGEGGGGGSSEGLSRDDHGAEPDSGAESGSNTQRNAGEGGNGPSSEQRPGPKKKRRRRRRRPSGDGQGGGDSSGDGKDGSGGKD
jgi:cell fate regulator YaaT (PSP1 superfamily)